MATTFINGEKVNDMFINGEKVNKAWINGEVFYEKKTSFLSNYGRGDPTPYWLISSQSEPRIARSTDNGKSWTTVSNLNIGSRVNKFASGNDGIVIAVGSTGSAYSRSTNFGQTWTLYAMPTTGPCLCHFWKGYFYLTQRLAGNALVFRSVDGLNWSAAGNFNTGSGVERINGFAHNVDILVHGADTSGRIGTTTNGTTWTNRTVTQPSAITSVTYEDGVFLAIGHNQTGYAWSLNGESWTIVNESPNTRALWAATAFKGIHICPIYSGDQGCRVFTSSTRTFSSIITAPLMPPSTGNWQQIDNNEEFALMCGRSTTAIWHTVNGQIWEHWSNAPWTCNAIINVRS